MQKFKKDIANVCIINKMDSKFDLENKILVLYVSSKMLENILMYKYLSSKNTLYITYSNFKKYTIGNKECVSVLNIGDKYKIFIQLKKEVGKENLKYIALYIAILISDFVVINKINNINEGMMELDIALDLGKDIYAIPGDIFDYKNYLANFAIKQGAIPICNIHDMKYILREKKFNVL